MLMEEGYRVHLANPAKIQQYSGLKYSDDKHDAFWLADMLRLGILPKGYIYPKESRPIRDLLRKRSHLVKLRTSLIISLQNIIARNVGSKLKASDIKVVTTDRVKPLLEYNEDLALAGKVSKNAIDSLSQQIKTIEKTIGGRIHLRSPYDHLLSIPGVGPILDQQSCLRLDLLVDFLKSATTVRTAEKSLLEGSVTTRGKERATRKMAIIIWHVLILKQQSMRSVMTKHQGSFSIAS
jgi:transposase